MEPENERDDEPINNEILQTEYRMAKKIRKLIVQMAEKDIKEFSEKDGVDRSI